MKLRNTFHVLRNKRNIVKQLQNDVRVAQNIKDHTQRIPKNCYKTIFRNINTEEIFSNLHSLQIKTIF